MAMRLRRLVVPGLLMEDSDWAKGEPMVGDLTRKGRSRLRCGDMSPLWSYHAFLTLLSCAYFVCFEER